MANGSSRICAVRVELPPWVNVVLEGGGLDLERTLVA